MKSPVVVTLLLVVGAVSFSSAEQRAEKPDRAGQSDKLTIGTTVEPTCTVAVTGAEPAEEAVQVACRNLRVGQPQPILLEAGWREGREVVLVRF